MPAFGTERLGVADTYTAAEPAAAKQIHTKWEWGNNRFIEPVHFCLQHRSQVYTSSFNDHNEQDT